MPHPSPCPRLCAALCAAVLILVTSACQKQEPPPQVAKQDPNLQAAQQALQTAYPWREWSSIGLRQQNNGVFVTAHYRTREPEYLPWDKATPIPAGFTAAELFSMRLVLLRQVRPANAEGVLAGELVLMHRVGFARPEIPGPKDRPLVEGQQPGKSVAASLVAGDFAITSDHEAALQKLVAAKTAIQSIVKSPGRKPSLWTGDVRFPERSVRLRCHFKPYGQGYTCEFVELKKTIEGHTSAAQLRLRTLDELTAIVGNNTVNWSDPQEAHLAMQAILLDQPLSPTIEPRAASYRASLLSNFTLRPIDDSHIELSANGLPPTIVTRQP